MELHTLTAAQLAGKIRSKEISATEATKAALQRIENIDSQVDAFITVMVEQALAAAQAVDDKIAAGEAVGALAGVPVALKDNICTEGTLTSCASKMLSNFVPPFDATVVQRLKSAGGVIIGKTNLDEFAMGSSCENSYYKPTKNPWDLTRVPGGSSGGSAAAVAASEVPLALGSDTGGSVRQPACLCGIVGMKPTYGAVSRYGLVAFASSLDQIGPMGRTVDDVAMLYKAICGRDPKDATSKEASLGEYSVSLKGFKIGMPKEYFGAGIHPEVKEAIYKGLEQLKALGAEIVEVSLPSTDYALSAYYILSSAEASSNLARFDGAKYGYSSGWGGNITQLYETSRSEGFGDEVKRRIMLGTYVLSSGYYDAYYKRAKALQKKIAAEFGEALSKCDVLVTPLNPTTAFKLGEKENDPVAMYAGDICTVTLNIAGLPGISVPCGFDSKGLPVGMQFIGKPFTEAKLLGLSKAYETAVGGFAVKEM